MQSEFDGLVASLDERGERESKLKEVRARAKAAPNPRPRAERSLASGRAVGRRTIHPPLFAREP
jgi:hypothetical protein